MIHRIKFRNSDVFHKTETFSMSSCSLFFAMKIILLAGLMHQNYFSFTFRYDSWSHSDGDSTVKIVLALVFDPFHSTSFFVSMDDDPETELFSIAAKSAKETY